MQIFWQKNAEKMRFFLWLDGSQSRVRFRSETGRLKVRFSGRKIGIMVCTV